MLCNIEISIKYRGLYDLEKLTPIVTVRIYGGVPLHNSYVTVLGMLLDIYYKINEENIIGVSNNIRWLLHDYRMCENMYSYNSGCTDVTIQESMKHCMAKNNSSYDSNGMLRNQNGSFSVGKLI